MDFNSVNSTMSVHHEEQDSVPEQFAPLDRLLRESSRYRRMGPFTVLPKGDAGVDSSAIAARQAAVRQAVNAKTGNVPTIHTPSPWHAAIFLQALQEQMLYQPGLDFRVRGDLPSSPIFRGLSDSSYGLKGLITSLDRAPNQLLAEKQALCFAQLMQQLGNRSIQLELPTEVFRAVSQHYGLATNLMDWTPDPTVAVYFANRPSASSKGIVYVGSVAQFVEGHLKILLPPPLFERVRLQRGLFIEVTAPLDCSTLGRITFDKSPSYSVYQAGNTVQLLKEPQWIEHARKFIVSSIDDKAAPPTDLWKAWLNSDLPFHFSKEAPRFSAVEEFPAWLDFYEDMRYWLACSMNESEEAFRKDSIEALERDNRELVEWHRKFIQALGKTY
jgi:hypothetical protein